ncbi:MAG: DUF4157 domain-containing protein [Burkholderiaceae bacterium]
MRTFAHKPKVRPAESSKAGQVLWGQRRDAHAHPRPQPEIANQTARRLPRADLESLEREAGLQSTDRSGHDFSRVPTRHSTDDTQAPRFGADRFARPHTLGRGRSSEDHVVPGGGAPLAAAARARIESILGAPLGNVRIHRGSAAERAAAAVGAAAFTIGQDIVLGAAAGKTALDAGQASPRRTAPSQAERLLAHEAAHTIQQSGAAKPAFDPSLEAPLGSWRLGSPFGPPRSLPRTLPGGVEERQAEAAARGLERPTPGAPLAIAAAPSAAPAFTPTESFREIWPKFEQARFGFDLTRARMLARELATAPYDIDDLLNHGIELVDWLQHDGEPSLAADLLSKVRSVWMVRFVSIDAKLPSGSSLSWSAGGPDRLIALGKDAARAGKHDQAFGFFGAANEILSYYALAASEKRMQALGDEDARQAQALRAAGSDSARRAIQSALEFPNRIGRSLQYSDLGSLYDRMREIYGFYSVLEREALASGDAKRAAEARSRSAELHKAIKDKFTWGRTQTAGSISQDIFEPVEIAEVGYADTPKGPGLTLHGANAAETTLTQLPGLPSPKEIGNNAQTQNLGALQSALMAQTDFQAEIGRQPEIRKAFGEEPIDLDDTTKRQKVWQIMYGVFKQSGTGALGALMALIGRYLKAFTIHTMYNVRDWGKSYLDTEMPTDLAGRAERDCGVYALTVAWDVYQTVKRGDAKLEVSFDLVSMLEHVTLIITDKSTGEYYVVNNDQVSPPQRGDPLTQVAPQYGAVRGLPYTVGPAMTVALGSTKDPQKRFHDEAWTRYLAAVDWGLKLDIPPDVAKLEKTDPAAYSQKVLAIQQARYQAFYRDQQIFDQKAKALDPRVDALAPVAGDVTKLASALHPLADEAAALAGLFIGLGPRAGVVAGSVKSQALLPRQAQFLFTMEPGHATHPIARVALGILHLQALGGTPTPKEDALVKFCETVPMFKQQMDAYRSAGAMGGF